MPRELKEISELKEGNIIEVDGEPCKISNISSSMPGKHGHAKYTIEAIGLFDEKKRYVKESSEAKIGIPDVEIQNGQVISLSVDSAQIMDLSSYETFEISIPEEMKGDLNEGDEIKYVESMGRKKIRAD